MTAQEKALRMFAEKIIAGEYQNIIITSQDKDGTVFTFYDGDGKIPSAIGLANYAAHWFTKKLSDIPREDFDEWEDKEPE